MRHILKDLDGRRRLHFAVGIGHNARVEAGVAGVRLEQLQTGDAVALLDAIALVRLDRLAVLEPLGVHIVSGECARQFDGRSDAGRAVGES